MTQTIQNLAKTTAQKPGISIGAIVRELMILNEAFAEMQRLRRLDAAAMKDMGLPANARTETSLYAIANRIRARRSA